jgi:hypothetical protein
LHRGEVVRWNKPAGQTVGPAVAAGRIYVTDRRFIFCPNPWSHRFDAVRFPLDAIQSIDIIARTGQPYNGGLRRRMRVRLTTGAEYLFWTKRVDQRAEEIRRLVLPASR